MDSLLVQLDDQSANWETIGEEDIRWQFRKTLVLAVTACIQPELRTVLTVRGSRRRAG